MTTRTDVAGPQLLRAAARGTTGLPLPPTTTNQQDCGMSATAHTGFTARRVAIPALVLAAWLVTTVAIVWRTHHRVAQRGRVEEVARGHEQPAAFDDVNHGPTWLDDERLRPLREAVGHWRQSLNPNRVVVDQVCLVPDVPAFLEAIAVWDRRHFFPILIDDPAWTLPFLRVFRPARVVRFPGGGALGSRATQPASSESAARRDDEWARGERAVARAWSRPQISDDDLPVASRPLRVAGLKAPPGIVITDAEAPMFPGAVALAAGRFQPLLRGGPLAVRRGDDSALTAFRRFDNVLKLDEALSFARAIEARVAAAVPDYQRLDDDCDFLTVAGDWPYRYSVDPSMVAGGGLFAVDDLIGRVFDWPKTAGWLARMRRRWAYAGRLLGGPAESVARAMSALFLPTESALLWDTYGHDRPWSDYAMGAANNLLGRALADPGALVHRERGAANLASWHRTFDPVNRFGLVLVNSSGGPKMFSIGGGPGRPSDIPRGMPAAVAMIHSFSAASPTDPATIAGRWLSSGAFVYFCAMNEPYLIAFRPPGLVAELIDAGAPLIAALRQGETEPYGFPWRLVYLGDPLYRPRLSAAHGGVPPVARMNPATWLTLVPDLARWPTAVTTVRAAHGDSASEQPVFASDDDRLRWCLDSAIVSSTSTPSPTLPRSQGGLARVGDRPEPGAAARGTAAWPAILREVHRDQLDRDLRPWFDELLIDVLLEAGALDELQSRLARVMPSESGPRIWQAHESCAMARLFRLADRLGGSVAFMRVLDLWDEIIRLSWPKDADFPAHFTERVAALVSLNPAERKRPWLERLAKAAMALAAEPGRFPHAALVAAEQGRAAGKAAAVGPR
jgi:hypothetical protein